MSEMEERIARAIFYTNFHPVDVASGAAAKKWNEWPEDRRRAERKARAVLAEIRIPTPEMLEAANAAGSDLSPALPHEIWPAMIDAAIGNIP